MSKLPIDIVNFNNDFNFEIETAVTVSNGIQSEFIFGKSSPDVSRKFQLLNFDEINTDEFMPKAISIKESLKGFFPHLIFFTASPLSSAEWSNLYASHESEKGISIVTTANVPDIILPKNKMASFFMYYLARVTLRFIIVDQYNHKIPSPNGCLFDFMEHKKDLLKSMRPNAICDSCRREILKKEHKISENQLNAIDVILAKAGSMLNDEEKIEDKRTKIFIGSSTEGLNVARKIKSALRYDAHVDTWADGLFDRPSQAYIEVLENILNKYEYGIFVFTPDDKIFSRGQISNIPRDNVIFEYGMFLGKHTRKKAFFIVPRGIDIKLMTDVLGITSLDYDPTNSNLQSAVSDACDQIREIIGNK